MPDPQDDPYAGFSEDDDNDDQAETWSLAVSPNRETK